MARLDPHSFADSDQPRVQRVELDLRVDFSAHMLRGEARLQLERPAQLTGPLDLDTRDLTISRVSDASGGPLPFTLGEADPILGTRLRIDLPAGCAEVRIRYQTSPHASALQWVPPEQTATGVHPFLYSQCQAIHARSVAPLQDTPACRIRIGARFTVPAQLRALMAAGPLGREVLDDEQAIDLFEMQQPIPPYLLAFAVGDLTPRQVSLRSAVWAERAVADAAAAEFDGIETMLAAAEDLFGPYEWERFDVLVLPPSFPYGGMENPRLTFVTPTLVAGDRSLVNVLVHELAHAWTGNLVTNASANDFWLNEGFTVYAERRILEALEGREAAELHAAIGRHDLEGALHRFAAKPELTRLRTDLRGLHPDEAFSTIPYEKGYLLLRKLEELAGRPAWDEFLRKYIETFRFRSIVTQDFLELLERTLPGLAERAHALRWIDEPGLPPNAPVAHAPGLATLRALAAKCATGELPGPEEFARRTPTELQVFLQALPRMDAETCQLLGERVGLSGAAVHQRPRSVELQHLFVLAQLRSGDPEGRTRARELLLVAGRMKYLRPLYGELCQTAEGAAFARRVFEEASARYHPIAQSVVGQLLQEARPQG